MISHHGGNGVEQIPLSSGVAKTTKMRRHRYNPKNAEDIRQVEPKFELVGKSSPEDAGDAGDADKRA